MSCPCKCIGELCKTNVVTELLQLLFKKPKLRPNYSAPGLDREDDEELRKTLLERESGTRKLIIKVSFTPLVPHSSSFKFDTLSFNLLNS